MLKVVTTKPVDKDIQDAVNQIPEIKIGGVFGIPVGDEETGFACIVGKDVTIQDLLSLRTGCKELLMTIDNELERRQIGSGIPAGDVLASLLERMFGR